MSKADQNKWSQVGRYLSLAMMLPICVVIGYGIGYWLDQKFGTGYLYIVGLLFGIAAGFVELIREVQKDAGD